MDNLLSYYSQVERLLQVYKLEIESIRAQIEFRLEHLDTDGVYENDAWYVRLIPERESRSIAVNSLEEALRQAGLTTQQEAIIQSSIRTITTQQSIRISRKSI